MRLRRRLEPNVTVDLVPMIDVVFQLVVFFMVSSTFIMTPGINLDLPQSASSEAVAITPLVVTVVSERELYLNNARYALADLHTELAALTADQVVADAETRSIVVEGDADVPYQLLVTVLDILRRNGYRGVSLRTRAVE